MVEVHRCPCCGDSPCRQRPRVVTAGGCGYCGADRDRIEVTVFGGRRSFVFGECQARCVVPQCMSCDGALDEGLVCWSLDCPVAFHVQPLALSGHRW